MFAKLLLLFTAVPLLELWLLIEVGKRIGTIPTILLVAITGFLGVLLARSQGLQAIYKMQEEMRDGFLPTGELIDGACILVGGAFLLTPGLVTDLAGFSLLIPITRELWKNIAYKIIKKMMSGGTIYIHRRY